jgi:hypothetical protein
LHFTTFQSGIRDLRTWEDELHFGLYESGYPPDYKEVLRRAPEACANFNVSGVPRRTQGKNLMHKRRQAATGISQEVRSLSPDLKLVSGLPD